MRVQYAEPNIPRWCLQVAEGLRTLMLGLYDVHLAPDGRRVDYPALVRDPNFADYTTAATELQKVGAWARVFAVATWVAC